MSGQAHAHECSKHNVPDGITQVLKLEMDLEEHQVAKAELQERLQRVTMERDQVRGKPHAGPDILLTADFSPLCSRLPLSSKGLVGGKALNQN